MPMPWRARSSRKSGAPLPASPTSSSTRSPERGRISFDAMPTYQIRGDVPRKRHIQFRDNGSLLTEEVMGLEGFTGNESILYHLTSPCRVKELGEFEPIEREEWVPDAHAWHLIDTKGIEAWGDPIRGRRLLMWNADVEIAICRPAERQEEFFKNGEGDEVIFVHHGS